MKVIRAAPGEQGGGWWVTPVGAGELSGGCDSSPGGDGGCWKEGGGGKDGAEKWADSGYI